jgi:biotin carboxyl carrier protein
VAPTNGVFYGRPAPDAEPFVRVGERIAIGQPIGLIEVMKTFNQILFEGVIRVR